MLGSEESLVSTTGAGPIFVELTPYWRSGPLDNVLRKWLLIVMENRKVLKKISLTLKCFKTTEYFPKALGFLKTYRKISCYYVNMSVSVNQILQ